MPRTGATGAAPSRRDSAAEACRWESAVARLEDPVDPAFVRDFQNGTAAAPLDPAFLDMVIGESLALPAWVWRALFAGFLADDQIDALARITAPTVVMWGDRDPICPRADQETLARAIPGARLAVLPDVGHALHWENPQAAAEAVCTIALGGTATFRRSAGVPARGGALSAAEREAR